MMYNAIGLVIKKNNFREDGEMVTLFTKEYGKISFLSRGGKKPVAKLTGHLQLLDLTEVMFVQGRKLKTVTSAISLPRFYGIKKDLRKTSSAFYIINLLDKLVIFEERDEKIWQLVFNVLELIDREDFGKDELKITLNYFEFRLLGCLGFEPDLAGASPAVKSVLEKFNESKIPLCGLSEKTLKILEEFLNESLKMALDSLGLIY